VVTALAAEARPFLDQFQFKAEHTQGYRSYANDDYLLLQTGMGKLKAAAAVAALLQANPDVHGVVNVGIAGGDHPLGTLLLAHQVIDVASQSQWFPHLPDPRRMDHAIRTLPTAAVHSVDQPCDDYRKGVVFDMEASGVFSAATRYLSTSQIHCIKVISDNPDTSVDTLTTSAAKRSAHAIHDRFSQIQALLEHLRRHGAGRQTDIHTTAMHARDRITARIHHTHAQTAILMRLLERLFALGTDPTLDFFLGARTADEVRELLQQRLSATPIRYGG
jgi:nucleoside phosphorylase